jgi:hypothetical protein
LAAASELGQVATALASDLQAPAVRAAENRQRRLGSIAMVALGAIVSCMVLQHRLMEPDSDVSDLRTDGPFRTTIAADGSFQLGAAVGAFRRGEAFGWTNSFCVAPETVLLMQVRLVHMADNRVLLYQERNLPADAHGCSSATWNVVLPPDAPPGRYHLQRFLMLTPATGAPRNHTLPSLEVNVAVLQQKPH